MNLRTVLKAATAATLVGAYLRIRRLRSTRLIHVLGYHRVVDHVVENGPVLPSLCISTDTFYRQMQQVKSAFRVLTLQEALAAIDGTLTLDRDACTITFDDGYEDVYRRAAPVLADLQMPATVFVPSGFVGTDRRLTHDRLYAGLWKLRRDNPVAVVDVLIERLPSDDLKALAARLAGPCDGEGRVLDAAELRSLADAGWEIGGHTIDHTVLVHEPPERVENELRVSKQDLEVITGRPCRYFAYCNGLHSPSLVEALRRLGYQGAVTTCDRPNRRGDDPFRIGRKILWEGHARGYDGRWSPTISAANLHDLFGWLGLTRPVDGEVACVA
jgi:peptidoglycan/xylan/chitin deacetylase (PgdA/CDA1 family)